ncbi:MAG: cytidylyltransferase domain-containing protein [bacterium]
MKKHVAIIQARMGSTRLPGKVLMDIAGKPVLTHVIERVRAAQRIEHIVVATTNKVLDTAIIDVAKTHQVEYYAGSEDDVLERYYRTACLFNAGVVVRITADCPLIDPNIIDKTVEKFLDADGRLDYVSTDDTFPDGLDTEVFSFSALTDAWKHARLQSEREHVTPYIYNNPERFRIATIHHNVDLGHLRLTLDQVEDLILIREIFERAKSFNVGYTYLEEVLEILETHPDLKLINAHISRNEGYRKSLENDFVSEN